MTPQPLAERLRAGDRLLGLMVKLPAPAAVEIGAYSGFDFVLLDTEHGLADGDALQHHIRAAAAAGAPALVRVGASAEAEVLRALDAGADGVVVPHVASREQAEAAVAAARYPPEGRRGLALSTSAGRYGARDVAAHLADARRRTVVIVQLEDAEAVGQATAIVTTPGVDAAFVGTADLSASLGHAGEPAHPDVRAAVDAFTAAAASAGLPLASMARDEQDAAAWFARGGRVAVFEASLVLAERLRAIVAATTA